MERNDAVTRISSEEGTHREKERETNKFTESVSVFSFHGLLAGYLMV